MPREPIKYAFLHGCLASFLVRSYRAYVLWASHLTSFARHLRTTVATRTCCVKVSGRYPLSSPARPRVRGTSGVSLKSRCREGVVPCLCALAPFLSEIMGADERSLSEAPCPLS